MARHPCDPRFGLVAANGSGKKSFERLKREEHALRDSIKRFSASDNRGRDEVNKRSRCRDFWTPPF
jgi:hypothetical protein